MHPTRRLTLSFGLVRCISGAWLLALTACPTASPPQAVLPSLHAGRDGGPIPVTYLGPRRPPRAPATAAPADPSQHAPTVAPEPVAPAPSASNASEPKLPIERGPALGSGWWNPLPGGTLAGYRGDTGLDIASPPKPVYAIAAGTIDYAEAGHTRWVGPHDTPYCVRITLDRPIAFKRHQITHVYYAHMSSLAFEQREGARPARHVEGGERLGTSGVANGLPHLHLGLLLDGDVSQERWSTILDEGEVRAALGVGANGTKLPAGTSAAP
jgi:murein DD-endopeptidase MepM/ murein hydrolase activator NlpD